MSISKTKFYKISGMTLVELLTVIAVSASLAAIGISNYRRYLFKTRMSYCIDVLESFKPQITETLSGSNTCPTAIRLGTLSIASAGSTSIPTGIVASDPITSISYSTRAAASGANNPACVIKASLQSWLGGFPLTMVYIADPQGFVVSYCGFPTTSSSPGILYLPSSCNSINMDSK